MSDEDRSKPGAKRSNKSENDHLVLNLRTALELASLLVAHCFLLNAQHIATTGTNNIDMMFLRNVSM